MTNFLDIIHRLSLIKKTHDVSETGVSPSSGKKGTPTLLGLALFIGPNRVGVHFLPDDGDRLQSPKRREFSIKDRRRITSKLFVIQTKPQRDNKARR
jgi:hypothetical protein